MEKERKATQLYNKLEKKLDELFEKEELTDDNCQLVGKILEAMVGLSAIL